MANKATKAKRPLSDDRAEGQSESKGKKPFGHWSKGLLGSMEDPELVVESDDTIVIIKDKYPKAKFHFLVLPKENIANLKSLKSDHLDLLKHMDERGKAIAEKSSKNLQFRYGYHAIPSMSQVHLHVISQDFDSPCLKNKKHWNSFTTSYFVDSKDIIEMLEKNGKVQLDTQDFAGLLKTDLRCHVCEKPQKNIPTLKDHIKIHSYVTQ